MDRGFFSSREFAVAGVVALLLVVGAGVALRADLLGFDVHSSEGCDAPGMEGAELPAPAPQVEDSEGRRHVRWSFDPAGRVGGTVAACAGFGAVGVGPSPDGLVHVAFTILADGPEAQDVFESTDVRAGFHETDAGLGVVAWVEKEGYVRSFGSVRVAEVSVEILVPADGAYAARLDSGHGLVSAEGLMLRESVLRSGFGAVRARDVDAQGNLTLVASHGAVEAALSGARNGTLRAESAFGSVTVRLPARADLGYDVMASSGFGEVDVAVGAAEIYESEGEGMGDRVHVRTAGYADKPTQVVVQAESGHGTVRVSTGEA